VGVHREARIAHVKGIKKLRADLAPLDDRIANEKRLAGEMDSEAEKLTFDAAGGDQRKLAAQATFYTKSAQHVLQAKNLDKLALPVREAIAKAEAELPRYLLGEAHERVVESIAELPAMSAQLSEMIRPIAKAFGEFKKRIDAAAREAFPLVARGDEERTRQLVSRLRTVMFRGMRAQMAADFHTEGVDFFTGESFEAATFHGVVEPTLRMMISALEIDLCANGVATPSRGTFRCVTNISGLFGLFLRVGEVVSLPTQDESVQRLIGSGALVILDAPAGVNTEERE
jgi:hypothetical protein